ncbi:hypothetical protein KTC96_14280 [Clostridium estertheticum]|uniref:hypothetical protein n=1 Tax=Clostridium estertheticum TaxID=238834 RepID=UPI001C7D4A04|nr:hypothetical protein [Clostridium estertheticum]MBX4258837.1 hypothetical protein [Clostridium estertheticum]WLC69157.1 hypothetical protein KTC96_14280 [Clostridium estertheticum]
MDKIELSKRILRGEITKDELAVSIYVYIKCMRIEKISLNLLMESFGYKLRTETAVKFRKSLLRLISEGVIAVSEDIEKVKRSSNFSIAINDIVDEYLEVNEDIFNLVVSRLNDKALIWLYMFLLSFKHKYEIYGAVTINMMMLGFHKDERTVRKFLNKLNDCGLINRNKSKVGNYNLFYYTLEEFNKIEIEYIEITDVESKKWYGILRRDLGGYGLMLLGMQESFLPKFQMSNRVLSLLIQGSIDSDKLKVSMNYHKRHVSYLRENHVPAAIILNTLIRISYENYYSVDFKIKIYNSEYIHKDEQERVYYYVDIDGNVQCELNKIERDKKLLEISKIKEAEKARSIDEWKQKKEKEAQIEWDENVALFG